MSHVRPAFCALVAALTLAACNSTGSPTAVAGLGAPAATGCAGEVGRFQAVLDSDLGMGHVNKSVYDRASADLSRASAACSAGRDAEAVRMVAATKARFGYY